MADQEFAINIVATANTGAIQLTQQQLTALQNAAAQGNKDAIKALKELQTAQKAAQAESDRDLGLTGRITGVGTVVTLLTAAVAKWKEFSDEQDKEVDRMIKAQEKTRELGLSLADTLQEMKFSELLDSAPLQTAVDAVTQRVRVLKTELNDAFAAGRYDDAKNYVAQLRVAESQLNRFTNALERETAAAEKAAEANARAEDSFFQGAVKTADLQVQRALQQEDAARRAEAAGQGRDADLFRKASEDFQKGFTQSQREQFQQLNAPQNQQGVIDAIQQLRQELIGIWR